MSGVTGIEWTDATWNPIRGCSRVSEGCRNCYAEKVAHRFSRPGSPYDGVVRVDANGKSTGQWNGEIKFVEERLLDPLRWKKPLRIFVNSMSDLFHPKVTDEMLDRIFAVMALCPQHTFQVLTKRPERMLEYLRSAAYVNAQLKACDIASTWIEENGTEGFVQHFRNIGLSLSRRSHAVRADFDWPLPNVWLGVSVEDQKAADERIPLLLQTPAAVRFVSAEPLLGPVEISSCRYPGLWSTSLDWVICGGESGPGARPMHPDWARSLRDQCVGAGVPFFFKQWGEWQLGSEYRGGVDNKIVLNDGRALDNLSSLTWEEEHRWSDYRSEMMARVGKKVAGDLLDGQRYHQFPEVRA